MSRSTAGLGLDPLRWLGQVATEHTGPTFCVAAAVAASRDPETGLYGATRDRIAQLARVDNKNAVWPRLRDLTGTGYLAAARRGGGRGRPSLFDLTQPALWGEGTDRGGRSVWPKPREETDRGGRSVWPKPTVEDGRFQTSLLISAGANMNLNVQLRNDVAKAVLEHGLPATGREVEWLLEGVAERLADGVPAVDLVARFRQRYVPTRPNGWRSAKGAFMALTREPLDDLERAASSRRTSATPTPPAYSAPDIAGALPPAEQAARAAQLKARLRGVS